MTTINDTGKIQYTSFKSALKTGCSSTKTTCFAVKAAYDKVVD